MPVTAVLTFQGHTPLSDAVKTSENLGCSVLSAVSSGGEHLVRVQLKTVKVANDVAEAVLEDVLMFRLV